MPQTWFFTFDPVGEAVDMVCRAEGPGAIGEARDTYRPGDVDIRFPGLTYDVLATADAGTLVIHDDHMFEIIARRQPDDPSPPATDDDVRALFHPDLVASAGIPPKG